MTAANSNARGVQLPRGHRLLGAFDLITGALLLVGIVFGLPARWWPIDLVGASLGALFLVAGFGLVTTSGWSASFGRLVAGLALAAGLVVTTLLVLTAGHLSGLYGPVGMGGAALLGTGAVLVVPYLVVLPAAQLYILSTDATGEKPRDLKAPTAAEEE